MKEGGSCTDLWKVQMGEGGKERLEGWSWGAPEGEVADLRKTLEMVPSRLRCAGILLSVVQHVLTGGRGKKEKSRST